MGWLIITLHLQLRTSKKIQHIKTQTEIGTEAGKSGDETHVVMKTIEAGN
jgi:hypothetical protein